MPTWRRSRNEACTRTSTHGKPMTTRRAHTPCCLLTNSPTQAEDYHVCILLATYLLTLDLLPRVHTLPSCCSLPCAHARTPAYFTLTHELKRTFLSRLPTYYSLATRRVRSSRGCAMALSHPSATPPPSRRRAAHHLLTTAYYLSAQCLLLAAIAQATCSLTSTY